MTDEKTPGAIVLGWWSRHVHADTGEARALAARLRRASTFAETLAEPRVYDLSHMLSLRDPKRLALIAQALAGVKTHMPWGALARRLGAGDPRAMSELRFQRLIGSPDLAALSIALRRALPMVDDACDVAALGRDLLFWTEKTRVDWCFDYFGAAVPDAAPTPVEALQEDTKA